MSGIRTSIKVEGLDELRKALRVLPEQVQKNVLKRAVLAGALVIRNEARRLVPVLAKADPRRLAGAIKRNIIASTGSRTIASAATAIVRVRSRGYIFATNAAKFAKPNNPNWWWLVEFGTSKAAAQPFMRPAFETKKEEAVDAIKKELQAGIEEEAAKVGWRL